MNKNTVWFRAFSIGLFLVLSQTLGALAFATNSSIPNFLKVEDGIYRGGHPGDAGMKQLQKLKIQTIIDLENEAATIQQEATVANQLGIRFISYPMGYKTAPDPKKVRETLAELADPKNQPVFIHCKHGEDRTGLIVGLFREVHDGWSQAKAYEEMLADHFHPALHQLDAFFKAFKAK